MIQTMWRCRFFCYLLLLLLLMSPCTPPANSISQSRFRNEREKCFPMDRPHTSEPNTEFVVDNDGNIFLMQRGGRKPPIWSFSTGSPIHSSYQAPDATNDIVLEYLDDSEATNKANDDDGYDRWKVKVSREDLLNDNIPYGIVTTWAAEVTVYMVDGISGRLIRVYKTGDYFDNNNIVKKKPTTNTESNSAKVPLIIQRTDYKLEHFDRITRKLEWNTSVSHFRAYLPCDPRFIHAGTDNEFGPEILKGVYLPVKCGSGKTDVRAFTKPQLFLRVPRDRSWQPDAAYEAILDMETSTRVFG